MISKAGRRGRRTGPPVSSGRCRDFLHTESAGGVVLVAATVIALVWANSPWKASYVDLWTTHVDVSIGSRSLDLTLREWINDGLMTLFFFVVGLEIKRELVEGELREPRAPRSRRSPRSAGCSVPALSSSRSTGAARRRRRLGHTDGHRHRDGGRRAQSARQPCRAVVEAVPARARHRRRHRRDPRDRDLLLRRHPLRRACSSRSRWRSP